MRDLKNKLTTSGKGSTNIQSRRGKSFGYQVLGFGSGGEKAAFVAASGGTEATVCTNYKTHIFTGPGTFCVSVAGNSGGSNTVDYQVVAGGGGGGGVGGGGGGGGYRESVPSPAAWTASPIANPGGALPVSVQGYPIVVGGGGPTSPSPVLPGGQGVDSSFSTITSAGSGGGGGHGRVGEAGGSGGGGGFPSTCCGCGAGNTPPVSPAQGTSGGHGNATNCYAGGGGGATEGGFNGGGGTGGGRGGTGATTNITASPVSYSGGGGGATFRGVCVRAAPGAMNFVSCTTFASCGISSAGTTGFGTAAGTVHFGGAFHGAAFNAGAGWCVLFPFEASGMAL